MTEASHDQTTVEKKFWGGPAGGAMSFGGVLMIGGFTAGIVFWGGGFHTAMEATNELEFCISCHEMRDTVYEEYKESPHFMNASGVGGAVCSDCHVPRLGGTEGPAQDTGLL